MKLLIGEYRLFHLYGICTMRNVYINGNTRSFSAITNSHIGIMPPCIKRVLFEISARRGFIKATGFVDDRKLLQKDKLSLDYQLIYRAPGVIYWKTLSYAIMVTAVLATIVITIIFMEHHGYFPRIVSQKKQAIFNESAPNFLIMPLTHWSIPNNWSFNFMIVSLYLVNVMLGFFVRRLPLRIYRSAESKDYVAIFLKDFMPWKTKSYHFQTGSKYDPWFSFWSNAYFRLGKRSTLLFVEHFKTSADLLSMIKLKGVDY